MRREPGSSLRVQSYRLDNVLPGNTILDCLNRIKWEQDGSLGFRKNCRNTICGSCAMQINGRSRLACKENVSEMLTRAIGTDEHGEPVITVAPMGNLPVIRDLVVDLQPFWARLESIHPSVSRAEQLAAAETVAAQERSPQQNQPVSTDRVNQASQASPTDQSTDQLLDQPLDQLLRETRQTPDQRALLEQAGNCIACGACYSECNAVMVNPQFAGPQALAKAQRLVDDTRDRATAERLSQLGEDGSGVWGCTRCFACNEVCPMEVNPLDRISRIKSVLLAQAATAGEAIERPLRHRQTLVQMVREGGWIDERQFAIRVIGNSGRDWRGLASLAPVGWRMVARGKMPLTFEKSEGTDQVRGLIDAVRAVEAAQGTAQPPLPDREP
nr:2Fe-2S iron-sulfur cluster-binding protein [Limnothrix sp. FACHB-881]